MPECFAESSVVLKILINAGPSMGWVLVGVRYLYRTKINVMSRGNIQQTIICECKKCQTNQHLYIKFQSSSRSRSEDF